MPVDHYENFPVASVLVPRRLRGAIESVYWFARSADDIADEGTDPPALRLSALDGYRRRLDAIESAVTSGTAAAATHASLTGPDDAQWARLAAVIAEHALPRAPFRDLIDAFSQDVVKTRYADWAELESYCRRSANPVGRLMLHLFDAANDENIRDSDAICTSLQLLNFCQDVAIDRDKDRVYIPLDELEAAGVTIDAIDRGIVDSRWQRVFMQQLGRAQELLQRGKPLGSRLPGRFGLELRAIIAGGERIAARLEQTGGDIFDARPTLGRLDWLIVGWRALVPSRVSAATIARPALR